MPQLAKTRAPVVSVRHIGHEAQPLACIDEFAADPDALRRAAIAARFRIADHHYPGLRAPLPSDYLRDQLPIVAAVLGRTFGHHGPLQVIDASFSIVTTPPAALTIKQRLPHCDAFAVNRFALTHYLWLGGGGGTGFFRHRSTGFETIDEIRAPAYFARLDAEMRDAGPPHAGYIAGDTTLFQRTATISAPFNRAVLYRSCLLHSGAIAPDAGLSPDPAIGRLTATVFFSVA